MPQYIRTFFSEHFQRSYLEKTIISENIILIRFYEHDFFKVEKSFFITFFQFEGSYIREI